MPDPAPPVTLPNAEFIELKNISSKAIDLKGWFIADAGSSAIIKESVMLYPDSLIILSSNTAAISLSAYGKAIGITNFPSLDNDGDLIKILSPDGRVIHAVSYSVSWYKNDLKKNGGWTLEMVDCRKPWENSSNWMASVDSKGGTPGVKNSVDGQTEDLAAPQLIKAFTVDSIHVVLDFDETLDSLDAVNNSNYFFTKLIK